MPDWLLRALESRRVRNATLGGIGFMILASSGGALLANYTVAGMNPYYLAHASDDAANARIQTAQSDAHWLRDAVFDEPRYEDGVPVETADSGYGDAGYSSY
jgi:hypothetical protein